MLRFLSSEVSICIVLYYNSHVLGLQPITSSLGLGCLINNGGTANLTGLTAVRPRMMMDMFSINVVGPLMLTKVSRIGCQVS